MRSVSVALCTYNGERYLSQQIDSIINQSYPVSEIIVCDDCSTDKTIRLLEQYAIQYPIIKIHRNHKQLGFKKNFEQAASLCTSEYVAFSDQDDVWSINHIQVLMDSIGDYFLSCGNSLFVDESMQSLGFTMCKVKDIRVLPKREEYLYPLLYNGNFFQGACMLVKREFLNMVFPIPEVCKYHDSWIALSASILESITFTKDVINKYRQHSSSITTKAKKIYLPNDIISSTHKEGNLNIHDVLCDRYEIQSQNVKSILGTYKQYCMLCEKKKSFESLKIRFMRYKEIYMTDSYLLFLPRIVHLLLTRAKKVEF